LKLKRTFSGGWIKVRSRYKKLVSVLQSSGMSNNDSQSKHKPDLQVIQKIDGRIPCAAKNSLFDAAG